MKVADLKVGEFYKIRSDKRTHVSTRQGYLDIHLGQGFFEDTSKIRPFSHLIYLGQVANGGGIGRWVMYRGKKMRAYPNIWQHVVPLEE
jgi:hypothetical protein